MVYKILSFVYILAITTTIANMNDSADYTNINYTSNISYVIGCLNIIIMFFLLKNFSFFKKVIKDNWVLFLCLLIFFVSSIWSENKYISIKKLSQLIGSVFALSCLLKDKKDLFGTLYSYTIVALLLSIVFIIALPSGLMVYNGSLVPKGIFGHKNLLGISSGLGALICLRSFLKDNKKIDFVLFIMASSLVLLSRSMTAIMAFFVTMLLVIIVRTIKNELTFFIYLTFFLVLILLLGLLSTDLFDAILTMTGKDPTFTGRSLIWGTLINIGLKNPIIGSGYGSFFRADETIWLSNMFGWTASHAHNSLLQIFLETGFIGLGASCIFVFDFIKRIFRQSDAFMLSFIPFLAISGFFEPILFNKNFASVFVISLYLSTGKRT